MNPITSITWVMTLVILALAVSCAEMGVQPLDRPPKTIEEGLYIASESGRGMTLTFADLRSRQIIGKDQYHSALDTLQKTHDDVQSGLLLFGDGNYNGALTMLDKAEMGLHVVAAILIEIEKTQSTHDMGEVTP